MAQIKKKSSVDILCQSIKNMHPFYASYLIQRIEADVEELKNHLPAIFEKEREDKANGKINIFHPNFYVNYVNDVTTIINEIEINSTKGTNQTPNIRPLTDYFQD